MSPLSCPLYVAGWRARFGEVDVGFGDMRDKRERILRHAVQARGIGCFWAVEG